MKKYIFYFLLIVSALFIFFPIIYCITSSFMTTADIMGGKLLPQNISFENYGNLIENIPIVQFFFNSLSTALSAMGLQLLICSATAYALVFVEFKEKKIIYLIVIGAIFVPWEAIFVPNYFTVLKMGLLNTRLGIILPFISNGLGVFLMVQQFRTLNKSLIEAAKIDGCNHLYIYGRIVIPLSKGILSTWGVYSFLSIWNMYLWPLMVSTRPESRTIQIGLKMIKSEEGTNFGVLMAAVVMVIVPSLLVLFLGQKQLEKGLVSGAVKE